MNLLWLIPVLGFFVLEAWALKTRTDEFQPLTYWIRRYLPWVARATLLAWLVFHFLIEG